MSDVVFLMFDLTPFMELLVVRGHREFLACRLGTHKMNHKSDIRHEPLYSPF